MAASPTYLHTTVNAGPHRTRRATNSSLLAAGGWVLHACLSRSLLAFTGLLAAIPPPSPVWQKPEKHDAVTQCHQSLYEP